MPDLGAGTGKLTATLVALGAEVIAVEPDPAMLTELRRRGLAARIIFVSGYADDAFAKNLPEGQEFMFLPKPFTLKQLVEAVKSAMG